MESGAVYVGSVVGFGAGRKGRDAVSQKLKIWLEKKPGARIIRQEVFLCVHLVDGRVFFDTVMALKYKEG